MKMKLGHEQKMQEMAFQKELEGGTDAAKAAMELEKSQMDIEKQAIELDAAKTKAQAEKVKAATSIIDAVTPKEVTNEAGVSKTIS